MRTIAFRCSEHPSPLQVAPDECWEHVLSCSRVLGAGDADVAPGMEWEFHFFIAT